jgi:hypothetical protein
MILRLHGMLEPWFDQAWGTVSNRSRAAAPEKSAMTGRPPETRDGCKWAGRNNENETDHIRNAGAWFDGGSAG